MQSKCTLLFRNRIEKGADNINIFYVWSFLVKYKFKFLYNKKLQGRRKNWSLHGGGGGSTNCPQPK